MTSIALLAAAQVVALAEPRPARAFQPASCEVGVNLTNYLNDKASEIAFVDAFRQSSPWTIGAKGVDPQAPRPSDPGTSVVGPDGWVRSLRYDEKATARMFASGDGQYPAGVYTVLYDGDGEIGFAGANRVVGRKPGRIDLQVAPTAGPDAGVTLFLLSTNPADPVRNIRVILPGYETTYASAPWYPPFLRLLKPFHTIRFTPWQAVNYDRQKDWSDRRLPSDATQASPAVYAPDPRVRGVSYEDIIALANALDANPWVSVPVAATDDSVRRMARLFRDTLKPDLHPMIEYANEIWNPWFAYSFCYMRQQGSNLRLSNNAGEACTRNANGDFVPPPDPWRGDGQYYYYALRLSQIFDIWDAEYGADKDKIVHVVSQWDATPREIDTILNFGQRANRLADKADVIATGAYVTPFSPWSRAIRSGETTWEAVARMAPQEVTRAMRDFIDTTLLPRFMATQSRARKWGLGMVAYEGGDGNEASHAPAEYRDALSRLFSAAARDPGMGDVYAHLLDVWKASGGALFNQFNDVSGYGVFGNWGLLEYQDQPLDSSPKYTALVNWIAANGKTK